MSGHVWVESLMLGMRSDDPRVVCRCWCCNVVLCLHVEIETFGGV